ncbi:MAG: hypothetical protein Q4C72_00710 [Eubacteriales bacterium]|nr:hypothetical protein [Eubacteriales bacterium]
MKLDLQMKKKCIAAALLVVAALLSLFVIAPITSDPAFHKKSIAMLDEKKITVTEMTAAAAAASIAVSAVPGDATTPIADQIAELASYLLVVVGAIMLEKFLLTMTCLAAFRLLVPAACALAIVWVFRQKAALLQLAVRLTVFSLVITLTVPVSLQASGQVERIFDMQKTLDSALQIGEETEPAVDEEPAAEDKTGLSGWLSQIGEKITSSVSNTIEWAKSMLSSFIDAVAVLIITACVIPIAVLLFLLWVIKIIFGIQIPASVRGAARTVHGRFRHKPRAKPAEAAGREAE